MASKGTAEPAGSPPSLTEGSYWDLYLESVQDLLDSRLSRIEAAAIEDLLGLSVGQRVLDLACGHGRHARPLAWRVRLLVGIDRTADYLRRAAAARGGGPHPRLARADVRALPFPDGTFDAVYSWYASLFMYDEPGNVAALVELARVLRRGGRALVEHANPLRLAQDPVATARRTLADGSVVEEVATFDPSSGVERARRRLVRPGGEALAGTAVLRYYRPDEWGPLAQSAGLRVLAVTSTTGVEGPKAPDLIAVLERP
ncbi:MAG TPA: class I SAM-dependent methyltransferase [Anaeromyxobacter sp.]|nr:class I SAM-dependent methyltransferase [Anaeromyxobacter sp.]